MGNEYIYIVVDYDENGICEIDSVWVNSQRAEERKAELNERYTYSEWHVDTFILNEPDGEL